MRHDFRPHIFSCVLCIKSQILIFSWVTAHTCARNTSRRPRQYVKAQATNVGVGTISSAATLPNAQNFKVEVMKIYTTYLVV